MVNSTDTASLDLKEPPALHPHAKSENNQVQSEPSATETSSRDLLMIPAATKFEKDKNREWETVKSRGRPLALLDLPVDVLRLIVKEVTYTNDLIALALTNSALYKLAVPNLYSRFDIVWPDTSTPTQSSKSVDALSYGLATLCLPSKFAEKARLSHGTDTHNFSHRLVDNQYAKYTRKFSIGDGPPEWTSEYLITKESGKMLGTLVAIAVSKMINLETFVWDMPTGVLSDVFMALSSLQDENGQTKLERLWVRWHDNSSMTLTSSSASSPTTALPPPPPPPTFTALVPSTTSTSIGNFVQSSSQNSTAQTTSYALSRVEYPTFSILSPLKSLTVLDIDELSYLDEMAVLIERSVSRLQELRVGISKKACGLDFAQTWDGPDLQQIDHDARWPGESRIPITRLGGVLGVLVGRIYDIRRKSTLKGHGKSAREQDLNLPNGVKTSELLDETNEVLQSQNTNLSGITFTAAPRLPASGSTTRLHDATTPERKRLDGKLKLQTLALERVALSIHVCSRAIDWRCITNLTILNCLHHEALWRTLKRQFQPTLPPHGSPEGTAPQYHLALKHLHTDLVSPSLMSFIKDLAPNTLEVLFLQDQRRNAKPSVTLEQIFKNAIKRHRISLKKLLIDSSDKKAGTVSGQPGRWKHWAMKDEFLSYFTSGRMINLRELGIVIDYRDWHTLLQHLPQMANLRSLYIPHMLNQIGIRRKLDPKELAHQIVDIISLRRDIRLAYVGLWTKCFEISEVEHSDGAHNPSQVMINDGQGAIVVEDEDDVDGDSDGDDETEDDDDDGNDDFTDAEDDTTEEISDDGLSEADSFQEADALGSLPRLRLREILYYDDKVELFKARHGKL